MADSFWLSDAQMARIEPFFPLSHGIARVDAAMLSLVDAESARLHSLSPAQQAQLADLLRLVGDEFS